MSVIYIALPIALFLAILAVSGFIWSVREGQLDDLDTPAVRMLHEDDEPQKNKITKRCGNTKFG